MSTGFKIVIAVLMSVALFFGFLHLFCPNVEYNFERLHVFLFNLCCGGTIILYYTEARKRLSGMTFLLVTAVTGIAYIFFELTSDYSPDKDNCMNSQGGDEKHYEEPLAYKGSS